MINMLVVSSFLFCIDSDFELPIGLTEEEKDKLYLIEEMRFETDPPPHPIRSIAEYEPMSGVLIRYPFGISTSLIKKWLKM